MARGKSKDPGRPKGRMSSYAFFVQAQRETQKQQNESMPLPEFSKKCSEEWKNLSGDQKEKYEAMAAADKLRYDREMADYVPPPIDEGHKKGKRAKKDPDAPKRGMSAFLFYCNQRRPVLKEANPSWGMAELSKKLGEEWRDMDEGSRMPFEGQAVKDKQRYEQEMAKYKATGGHCEE